MAEATIRPISTATYVTPFRGSGTRRQEREPLFFRLEPERLPLLLRPFDDDRLLAVVRLLPLLDEPLPFDELLPRLDVLPLRFDELLLPLDELLPPLEELLPRLDAERLRELEAEDFDRPDAEDFDRPDDELRLRAPDDERWRLTSPSSITPRQDPVSSSSIITYALKRARSARIARFTCRIPRPAFSIREPGSTSIFTSTCVSRGATSWKVTTPVCVTPSITFHLMRSSGRCSRISALNSFEMPQIFVLKETSVSSSCETLCSRCMNFGQSSNWVHWL